MFDELQLVELVPARGSGLISLPSATSVYAVSP